MKTKNESYNRIVLNKLDKGDQLYLTQQERVQEKFIRQQKLWKK